MFRFTAELWRYPGSSGWHFVTLPDETADDIDAAVGDRAGFGSIPVVVTVGHTTWSTSLFPDKAAGSFLLPVKAAVRKAESLEIGAAARYAVEHDTDRSAAVNA